MADLSFNQQKLLLVVVSLASLTATVTSTFTAFPFWPNAIHTPVFVIQSKSVTRLCQTHDIITVNGQFPGPTLYVSSGDTLIVKVINNAQYNATIHWHGVRQMLTGWADGPEYITQCPIQPGGSYTYRFTIAGQQGTLWWHAHSSWLRATVYGALIISPSEGNGYPFPKPAQEIPILLGEWWNSNPIDVVNEAARTGATPNVSDAFTVNGQPGDLYPCSSSDTFRVAVKTGETNLVRVVNAALNTDLFFSIANHDMTVVGVDASYTKPYETNVLMLGPGQTTDVLVTFNKSGGDRYYIAARAYASGQGAPFDNTTTTAIVEYETGGSSSSSLIPKFPLWNDTESVTEFETTPVMPNLPFYNDTQSATNFAAGIRSLASIDHPVFVPLMIDENLFYTVGLGLINCPGNSCGGPNGTRFAASVNNYSFVLPSSSSILEAHHFGIAGVFEPGFPDTPPVQFNYTGQNINRSLWSPVKTTRVKLLTFNTAVQIILQGTNIFTGESHPIHLHGYDFYIVGSGFGNYNAATDPDKFNLVDPPMRNTVNVPVNGWVVIRFVADNPGTWMMHCHLDVHINWGLAMVFVVENGHDFLSTLEEPPFDLPKC